MPLTTDIFTLADAIIKEAGVNATNKERFQKLLASYLNNLRNELDTKERLRAPDNEGGIGLSQEDTDKVMKKAKETYSKLHSSQLVSQSAKQHDDINEDIQPLPLTAHRSATSDAFGRSRIKQGDSSQLSVVSNIKSQIPNPKLQINTNNQNSKQEQQPLPTKDVPHNLPVVSEEKPLLVIEDVDGLPTLIQKSVTGNQKPVTSTKSQIPNDKLQINTNDQNAKQQTKKLPTTNYQLPTTIQGIPLKVNVGIPGSPQKDSSAIAGVKRPQVLDPIEELRAMTLQDFRRLSQDPKEAAQKIYQKIMLLEKESFTKKTAGLEGWRDNEVNKLYLQMGRESFGKGVSMNEVIQQRKTAGKDFLVEPEFDALLELNGLLRS